MTSFDSRYLRAYRADGRMRPLDLVVDGLADIVEQAAALREHDITAELGCHDAGEVRDLDGMIEHVLAVARAVAQATEQSDELRMESVDAVSNVACSPASLMRWSTSRFAFSTISRCAPDGCGHPG